MLGFYSFFSLRLLPSIRSLVFQFRPLRSHTALGSVFYRHPGLSVGHVTVKSTAAIFYCEIIRLRKSGVTIRRAPVLQACVYRSAGGGRVNIMAV